MKLPNDILSIANLYKLSGKDIYVVGGAVRDHLRGISPKDYDLATNATPDESIKILEPYFNILEVGKAFGVIVAITPEFPNGVEIATFRSDVGTGRRPDSVIFTTIENDVLRRDLTINALFYNIDKGEIVDLVGGIKDLKERIIRTVGIPEDRFNDDPLRKFRAIRFASDLGGTLADDLYSSLQKNSSLEGVSPERIKDEFDKLLLRSKDIHKSLALLNELGILSQLFPNLNIDIDLIGKNSIVITALLLRSNIFPEDKYPFKRLQDQLNASKWKIEEIGKICYLLRLQNLSADNAYWIKKSEKRCKVNKTEIEEFLKIIGKPDYLIDSYLSYELSVDPSPLMEQGYSYIQLGAEIEKLETSLFLEIIKDKSNGT